MQFVLLCLCVVYFQFIESRNSSRKNGAPGFGSGFEKKPDPEIQPKHPDPAKSGSGTLNKRHPYKMRVLCCFDLRTTATKLQENKCFSVSFC